MWILRNLKPLKEKALGRWLMLSAQDETIIIIFLCTFLYFTSLRKELFFSFKARGLKINLTLKKKRKHRIILGTDTLQCTSVTIYHLACYL